MDDALSRHAHHRLCRLWPRRGEAQPQPEGLAQLALSGGDRGGDRERRVVRLLRLFPFDGVRQALADEYNRQSISELEKIRDFIILHYHQTERTDSPFWNYCRTMQIPDSLAQRMELFRESAHAFQSGEEMFRLESWSHVMLGQRLQPDSYHQLVAALGQGELSRHLHSIRETINAAVDRLPSHRDFLRQYCPSTLN